MVCDGVLYGGCWCLVWCVMVFVSYILGIGVLYTGCWCLVYRVLVSCILGVSVLWKLVFGWTSFLWLWPQAVLSENKVSRIQQRQSEKEGWDWCQYSEILHYLTQVWPSMSWCMGCMF